MMDVLSYNKCQRTPSGLLRQVSPRTQVTVHQSSCWAAMSNQSNNSPHRQAREWLYHILRRSPVPHRKAKENLQGCLENQPAYQNDISWIRLWFRNRPCSLAPFSTMIQFLLLILEVNLYVVIGIHMLIYLQKCAISLHTVPRTVALLR